MTTASRPGIPAAAKLARGPGPEDIERLYLTIPQEHTAIKDPRPGATRLEVGPRESRAGSRVPIYTSSSPAVQATCQGGAVDAPGAPPEGAPSHTQVEAPCSMLAVDTAEERLCPCTSGSTMLCAGDKQPRAASRSYQPQGAQSLVSSLIVTPPLGSAARGGWARGLRLVRRASLPERSQGTKAV